MDYYITWVFIGFMLAMFIVSFYISAERVFIIFYFIILTIMIVCSAIISYVWSKVTENVSLATMVDYYPVTTHILTYAPLYVISLGFIGMIITFAKTQKK